MRSTGKRPLAQVKVYDDDGVAGEGKCLREIVGDVGLTCSLAEGGEDKLLDWVITATDHEAEVLTQHAEGLGGLVCALLTYPTREPLARNLLLGNISEEGDGEAIEDVLAATHLVVSQQTDDQHDSR